MDYILRKSLLYKTGVEYGDYTINHVQGCSHSCKYPCYAYLMAKRFGRVKSFEEWCTPKIVSNAKELLKKELPKEKDNISSIHLCFTTDPFMFGHTEISKLSYELIEIINSFNIKCTALTKGTLPIELLNLSHINEYGITLISLDEKFRQAYEKGSACYTDRINALKALSDKGLYTWVSIEPYPTPNIIDQDFNKILESISFVDKIIFGRLNYNTQVTKYPNYKGFYNNLANEVLEFCQKTSKDVHIKNGTISNL